MQNRALYPDDWSDVIRPRILIRDKYKCCNCGIKHRVYVFIDQSKKRIVVDKDEHDELKAEGRNTYRIFLQVSHRDNDKSNCDDENLWSLCNQCHCIYDAEHKKLLRLANPVRITQPCNGHPCPYVGIVHSHSQSGVAIIFEPPM